MEDILKEFKENFTTGMPVEDCNTVIILLKLAYAQGNRDGYKEAIDTYNKSLT